MSNRATRRALKGVRGPYRPPSGLKFNEFVGELWPPTDRTFTELHVRYGERNGRYLDWSISLLARHGSVQEYRKLGEVLERRTLELVDVSESSVRRHVYDPYQPDRPPKVRVIKSLRAGDDMEVDRSYQEQMNYLAAGWQQKHGATFGVPTDLHTLATIGFAGNIGRPQFRTGSLSWVRNTVVCTEHDLADDVINERAGYYFPRIPSTVAVLRTNGHMQFIRADPGERLSPDDAAAVMLNPSPDSPARASGNTTMGMIADSVYSSGWTHEVADFLNGP